MFFTAPSFHRRDVTRAGSRLVDQELRWFDIVTPCYKFIQVHAVRLLPLKKAQDYKLAKGDVVGADFCGNVSTARILDFLEEVVNSAGFLGLVQNFTRGSFAATQAGKDSTDFQDILRRLREGVDRCVFMNYVCTPRTTWNHTRSAKGRTRQTALLNALKRIQVGKKKKKKHSCI